MPKACLKLRPTVQETKGKNHPAVFRDREQALFGFREKPQGKKRKKNLASISEFYQGKLQEYLVS